MREGKRSEYAQAVVSGKADRYRGWLEEWRHAEPPLASFHWEIEFPEVFERPVPGFDAVVGNPPFLGGIFHLLLARPRGRFRAMRARFRTMMGPVACLRALRTCLKTVVESFCCSFVLRRHPERSEGSLYFVVVLAFACSLSPTPKKVISTEAPHSLIVRRAVQNPLAFAFATTVLPALTKPSSF